MRVKREVFDAMIDLQVLKTGLTRLEIYRKHNFSSEIISKCRLGRNLHPKTIYRLAVMLECDPLVLVCEEDLPPVTQKKAR